MQKVKSLYDLTPKAGVREIKTLPKGKPLFRNVLTNGCFRQITYIFKNKDVYIRNIFKGKELLFIKKPEIVDGRGNFLT